MLVAGRSWAGRSLPWSTHLGSEAVGFWNEKYQASDSKVASGVYATMRYAASRWTPETATGTILTLATANAGGLLARAPLGVQRTLLVAGTGLGAYSATTAGLQAWSGEDASGRTLDTGERVFKALESAFCALMVGGGFVAAGKLMPRTPPALAPGAGRLELPVGAAPELPAGGGNGGAPRWQIVGENADGDITAIAINHETREFAVITINRHTGHGLAYSPTRGSARITGGALEPPAPALEAGHGAAAKVGVADVPPTGGALALPSPGGVPAVSPGAPASTGSLPAAAGAGPLFVDVQGGPAVRGDTGAPTFLPSLVAGVPGSRGALLEPADFLIGYSGITTVNVDDLAMSRLIVQNMPQWPINLPNASNLPPPPWEWNPTLAFPTSGPVQVLTTPGARGTTPRPDAFFPPLGGEVAPGVSRLVPVQGGGLTAQQDVTGLQVSTHPQLDGQVAQAYWRRPFGLATADSATTKAIGKEVARWLAPGGFLELRLLRGGEEAQALEIAAQIPGARVVTVPRAAILSYASIGARPFGLSDEQWAVLEGAGPDIRQEFGALGRGDFARIVRIYRGTL